MATVTFDNASRVYPGQERPAVDNLNIEIGDGEFLVLVGPSGCGKSTSLRMLAGLEEIDAGRILIGDRDVTDVPPKDRDIAMVFQNYALYPHMTVADNMGFALKIAGTPKAEIRKRVEDAAAILDLTEYLDRKPKALSGGQRQRVLIAIALIGSPRVIVADEPTSALDVTVQASILEVLATLQRDLGLTYLFISHDLGVVRQFADTLTVLRRGEVVESGIVEEVFAAPREEYTRRLIASIPARQDVGASA